MKHVLVVYYSQSGQLTDILANFTRPLQAEVEVVRFDPEAAFPFPWTTRVFFDTMPETVLEEPVILKELNFSRDRYDLIVLGYQPWFLSPSLPTTSLLKSEWFRKIVKDTPVVTVIGARNMWLNAQESVKMMIRSSGGTLVGNVPLIDKNPNLLSVVSILHWMLTGKKERKYGIFPLPGVSESDIRGAERYGQILNEYLNAQRMEQFQPAVVATGAIVIPTNILFIEGRAKKLFVLWARLIKRKGVTLEKRRFWVNFFRYYLLFALFIVSPIVLAIFNLCVRPFTGGAIRRKKEYFRNVILND